MDLKKGVRISMLVALSVVLNIIESMISIFNIIPGVKLGLANIVSLLLIYVYGFKEAILVSIVRVLIVSILRTGLFSLSFFFSATGSIFSLIVMTLFKKTNLSIIGVSILGSITHSLAQLSLAILILNNINVIYYFPIVGISSLLSGIIIGVLSKELILFYKNNIA